jgi:hypothetical protein
MEQNMYRKNKKKHLLSASDEKFKLSGIVKNLLKDLTEYSTSS